ncbi:MAG TPA: hypothetical protein VIW64_13535 [Pyrinomonadaceae bacterium]
MKHLYFSYRSKIPFATLFGLLLVFSLATTTALADESRVTTTGDESNSNETLRHAIDFANLHPGTTIRFDLPASQGDHGIYRIKLIRELPTITASRTTIDGSSQRE